MCWDAQRAEEHLKLPAHPWHHHGAGRVHSPAVPAGQGTSSPALLFLQDRESSSQDPQDSQSSLTHPVGGGQWHARPQQRPGHRGHPGRRCHHPAWQGLSWQQGARPCHLTCRGRTDSR